MYGATPSREHLCMCVCMHMYTEKTTIYSVVEGSAEIAAVFRNKDITHSVCYSHIIPCVRGVCQWRWTIHSNGRCTIEAIGESDRFRPIFHSRLSVSMSVPVRTDSMCSEGIYLVAITPTMSMSLPPLNRHPSSTTLCVAIQYAPPDQTIGGCFIPRLCMSVPCGIRSLRSMRRREGMLCACLSPPRSKK